MKDKDDAKWIAMCAEVINLNTMTIKPIKTKKDYQAALDRFEVVFDTKPGTPEGDELEVLGILIDKYEQEHFLIEFPDTNEAN